MDKNTREDGMEEGAEENLINVSLAILKKVNAAMDEDDYWINRLAKLDADHTKENALTMEDAEELLTNLEACAKHRNQSCIYDKLRLTECLKQNNGKALECEDEVNNFVDCVDKLSYKKLRPELTTNSRKFNKLSFAERFERMK